MSRREPLMRPVLPIVLLALLSSFFALVPLACGATRAVTPPAASSGSSSSDLWIRDVTVVSPERGAPLAHAHVLVHDRRIAWVDTRPPPDAAHATRIDGSGRFLVPGLIDAHVHLGEIPGVSHQQMARMPAIVEAYSRQLPRSYLYFGFTTVIDLAVVDRARVDAIRNAPVGPTVLDCGAALPLANAYPMAYAPPELRFTLFPNFIYDPRQADAIPREFTAVDHSPAADVARVAASGAICVKTFYERGFGAQEGKLPLPTLEMIRDVVAESHRRHLPLLIHANALRAHRFALDAGADVAVHGIWEWEQPEGARIDGIPADVSAVIDDEVRAGMGVMPTSRVISGLEDLFAPAFLDDPELTNVLPRALIDWYRSDEGKWFARDLERGFEGMPRDRIRAIYKRLGDRGRAAAAAFAARGGQLLFGSDSPSGPTYANPPGYNGFLEMRELEAAGISPHAILTAATIANAKRFGLTDRGTIEAGKRASLLLLRGDPLAGTRAFDAIDVVIENGRAFPRAELRAP